MFVLLNDNINGDRKKRTVFWPTQCLRILVIIAPRIPCINVARISTRTAGPVQLSKKHALHMLELFLRKYILSKTFFDLPLLITMTCLLIIIKRTDRVGWIIFSLQLNVINDIMFPEKMSARRIHAVSSMWACFDFGQSKMERPKLVVPVTRHLKQVSALASGTLSPHSVCHSPFASFAFA